MNTPRGCFCFTAKERCKLGQGVYPHLGGRNKNKVIRQGSMQPLTVTVIENLLKKQKYTSSYKQVKNHVIFFVYKCQSCMYHSIIQQIIFLKIVLHVTTKQIQNFRLILYCKKLIETSNWKNSAFSAPKILHPKINGFAKTQC